MPLVKTCTQDAFKRNIKISLQDGKPQNQAIAISFSTLKKACGVTDKRKMKVDTILAKGGKSEAVEKCMCGKCGEMVDNDTGQPCVLLTCPKCGEKMGRGATWGPSRSTRNEPGRLGHSLIQSLETEAQKDDQDDPDFTKQCECPACHFRMDRQHNKPCKVLECPKCGAAMGPAKDSDGQPMQPDQTLPLDRRAGGSYTNLMGQIGTIIGESNGQPESGVQEGILSKLGGIVRGGIGKVFRKGERAYDYKVIKSGLKGLADNVYKLEGTVNFLTGRVNRKKAVKFLFEILKRLDRVVYGAWQSEAFEAQKLIRRAARAVQGMPTVARSKGEEIEAPLEDAMLDHEGNDMREELAPLAEELRSEVDATTEAKKPERLKPALRSKIIKAFNEAGLDGNGRFQKPEDGYAKAVDIMSDFGIEIDGIPNSSIFDVEEGMFSVDITWTNNGDLLSQESIPNSMLVETFFKHSENQYEVLCYLS